MMILAVMCSEPTRFNAVQRRLQGITHKALADALRRLERNGLLARRVITGSAVATRVAATFGALYAHGHGSTR